MRCSASNVACGAAGGDADPSQASSRLSTCDAHTTRVALPCRQPERGSCHSYHRPVNVLPRSHQATAVRAIEESLAGGARHLVVSMPLGSGKTLTALLMIDRLLGTAAAAATVLYLGRTRVQASQMQQAAGTFITGAGRPFADVYPVFGPGDLVKLGELDVDARFVCVDTANAVRQQLHSLPPDLVDLVVYDGADDPGADFRAVAEYFDAITISFGPPAGADDILAFRYSTEQAINDGVLVNYRSARTRRVADEQPVQTRSDKRVILLAAESDRREAAVIAIELRSAGFDVWFDEVPDEMFTINLREIRSDDAVVVLLSPDSVATLGLDGVSDVLDQRGAEVLPAVLKPCLIPLSLADRGVIDLTAGTAELVRSLQWADAINLAGLGAAMFERLAADLLTRIGFTLHTSPDVGDTGVDYEAIYQDDLGFADPANYVVQVKHGSGNRLSVRELRELASHAAPRVLVVTNVQLTSLAKAMLRKVGDQGADIRVLDGLRIRTLLQYHPDLVARYFPVSEVAG